VVRICGLLILFVFVAFSVLNEAYLSRFCYPCMHAGSCPSSTVTMKMGIERVLKENFPNAEVVQVEDESGKPTELTYDAVEQEVKRIQPAIIAMGGVVKIIKVDPIGEVTLDFRGANKVRQGLEMALLDIPFCKHVKFVSS